MQATLAERDRLLQERDATIRDRESALRKSQTNPRPQDAQKLDELRRLLKEKDMEIQRYSKLGRNQ